MHVDTTKTHMLRKKVVSITFDQGPLGIMLGDTDEAVGGVIVAHVEPGSQGAAKGVLVASLVVGINGSDVRWLGRTRLANLIAEAKRSGPVTLSLRAPPPPKPPPPPKAPKPPREPKEMQQPPPLLVPRPPAVPRPTTAPPRGRWLLSRLAAAARFTSPFASIESSVAAELHARAKRDAVLWAVEAVLFATTTAVARRDVAACTVQRFSHGALARWRARALRQGVAATALQAACRGRLARRWCAACRALAPRLQAVCRGALTRQWWRDVCAASLRLQTASRRAAARRRVARLAVEAAIERRVRAVAAAALAAVLRADIDTLSARLRPTSTRPAAVGPGQPVTHNAEEGAPSAREFLNGLDTRGTHRGLEAR